MAAEADHHLLFGLIALQVGLVDQSQLVAAFQAWARDKSRPLADHLAERGGLDADSQSAVEAMVALHLKKHGSDAEKSLAAIPAPRSARERLAALGDPELTGTVTRLVTGSTDPNAEGTVSYGDRRAGPAVANAAGDGQRFQVLRPHAKGGLGVVFVALDSELHREVALKQIQDSHADDPISRRRFILEAEITGGLEHPGIVPVYGLGNDSGGRPYYAMRFIGGESFKEAVERFHKDEALKKEPGRRSLELRKLLRRFIDVCNAIDYAHSRGVLHRDLKPSNIILGKHGETLVVDWGLAKTLGKSDPKSDAGERTLLPSSGSGSDETLPGSTLGTPGYMSPEQARGDLNRVGPRSDIYALGATLYCLLTGRPPFESDDVASLLRKVQWGEFTPPRKVVVTVDPALEAICLKAMTFAPEERYATSRALADDIERWTAGQPVSAWQEPLARRARRWVRRGQTVLAAVVASIAVALAGSAYLRNLQTRARADVNAAHKRELQRFNLAMDAVKSFHSTVDKHPLLGRRQFEDLRTKLVTDAAATFGRLEETAQAPRDRDILAVLGNAYDELGGHARNFSDPTTALGVHRKALAVHRALAFEPRAGAGAMLDLARCLIAVGRLERSTGDTTAAVGSAEEARSLAKELATTRGNAEVAREVLTAAAIVLSEAGDHEGALAAYRDAVAIDIKLADAKPSVILFQTELADSLLSVAQTLVQCGRPGEATAFFDRQEEVWLKIADTNATVPDYRHRLARCQIRNATVLLRLGKPAEARARCQRAVVHCESLMSAHPDVQEYRLACAEALLRLGQAHRANSEFSSATADWRRAAALVEAVSAPTGEELFVDAGCHASIAFLAGLEGTGVPANKRAVEAERAMAMLRHAVNMGFRKQETYRTETALDPIRDRDDFRVLVMDLAMPADALARDP